MNWILIKLLSFKIQKYSIEIVLFLLYAFIGYLIYMIFS